MADLAKLRISAARIAGDHCGYCYTAEQLADEISKPRQFVADLIRLAKWAMDRIETDSQSYGFELGGE